MRRRTAALPTLNLAVALLCIAGCTDVITVWVDPEIYVGATTGAVVIEGEPNLSIGYVTDETFENIADTQSFDVVWGLQGGYWSMPHLRVTGIGDPQPSGGATMYMTCRLTSDAGEVLTDLNVKARLYVGDGFLFAPNYPIPVVRAPPAAPEDVPALDGVMGRFECSVRDNSNRTASISVLLSLSVDL